MRAFTKMGWLPNQDSWKEAIDEDETVKMKIWGFPIKNEK